jgi:dolichyl-phosphooligosaccharide-protein glycotransferase
MDKTESGVVASHEDKQKNQLDDGDEVIELNFSKIKSLFKSKTKSPNFSESPKNLEPEEIPKLPPNFPKNEDLQEAEIDFDLSKFKNFWIQHYKWIFPLLLVLTTLFFSVHLRMMPSYLPATEDWALNNIKNQFEQQASSQILQESPNLPKDVLQRELNRRWDVFKKENKDQIDAQIPQISAQFKSWLQDDNQQTYLIAIDPYLYFLRTRNILDHGHPGDILKDGKPWNSLTTPPIGRPADMNAHQWFGSKLATVLSLFGLTLMGSFFLIPVIISALSVVPAFFIGRKLGGDLGGFFAGFLVAIHSAFLMRTPGGFSDTDAYNIFFPLLITWIFLEGLEAKTKWAKFSLISLSGLFVGLYAFTWSNWWYSFDILVFAVALYIIYYIITNIPKYKFKVFSSEKVKNNLIILFIFIVSSAIFTILLTDFRTFSKAFLRGPLQGIFLKEVGITKIWPNVFTTVAELGNINLSAVVSQLGGSLVLTLASLGLILSMFRKNQTFIDKVVDFSFLIISFIFYLIFFSSVPNSSTIFLLLLSAPLIVYGLYVVGKQIYTKNIEEDRDLKYAFILLIWFLVTFFATTRGIRFTILVVPALGVAFGISAGVLFRYMCKFIEKYSIDKILKKVIPLIIILLIFVPVSHGLYKSGRSVGHNSLPSMNDAWWNSLTWIKDNNPDNTVITSWWDFGHWFKAIAQRPVTFDGGSQNTPFAHWVGNFLKNNNEEEAIGILRMIDCGANQAFDTLSKELDDDIKTIDTLYDIIVENKEQARKILENEGLDDTKVSKILEFTHCTPPPAVVIASEDMVPKSGVWAHFGSWDFKKAVMYQEVKKSKDRFGAVASLIAKYNLSEKEANNLYGEISSLKNSRDVDSWIAPWPSYIMGSFSACQLDFENNILNCPIRGDVGGVSIYAIVVPLNAYDNAVALLGIEESNLQPAKFKSLAVSGFDGFNYLEFNDSTIGLSVLLKANSDGSFGAMITPPELVASTFTKMYFLEGNGLKYFDLENSQTSPFGNNIKIYSVDWNGESETNNLIEGKIRASHILICHNDSQTCVNNRTKEEALDLAKKIRIKLTPENFADKARELSEGPSSVSGGSLGWFGKGAMVPQFEEVVFNLEKDQISEVTETPFGYHIIILNEK